MWRLKGGVENGKGFDTHANCLGAGFLFAGCIRIARELRALLTVSISPLDSADDSLLVASVDVRKSNNATCRDIRRIILPSIHRRRRRRECKEL